ncbi:hypothetical protein CAEBREN_25962 [Caenorhabditis brenneri]|uniref:Uncharacterized protein n=1 Tax=Caenorhabditis brenneri TaxID=135651 RepID=G0NVR7_CAEBE|nr:hypothetical protein CAEBREN_25962 [Caenorhabditis brenneri]
MISISGDFVKLLLLLPLILCANDGLKKLSEEENEKVLENCGKFENLNNGVSIEKFIKKDNLVSWISPHHFLVDASILPKEFDEDYCKKYGKYFSRKAKNHGLFLGNCDDVRVGMILMESSEVQKHWLCIQNDTSENGDNVKIVENPKSIHQANVVGCDQNSPATFCLTSDESHHGHVIFGAKGSWSIGGYVINADDVKQIKVWNLDDHRTEICDFSGICNNVVYIPRNPTTEVITTEATITDKPDNTSPENYTTLNSETSPKPEITLTAETIAIAVADNTTEVPATTEEQSTEVSKAMQPETTQESSNTEKPTDIPTASGADNNQTIPVNQSTGAPSNPSDAPSTDDIPITQPTVPDVGTSQIPKGTVSTVITGISTNPPIGTKPQALPLKTEEIVEEVIDCEEENLCFSEDFFSSSNHFNTLSLISSVLVLIFI